MGASVHVALVVIALDVDSDAVAAVSSNIYIYVSWANCCRNWVISSEESFVVASASLRTACSFPANSDSVSSDAGFTCPSVILVKVVLVLVVFGVNKQQNKKDTAQIQAAIVVDE
ncbi:hypothetical protein BDF19DRAFT_90796 [Syncephalis fuscata]|nr:hypothetical protein BDF19DRAFT_90796 [Syncephalis fuscata]